MRRAAEREILILQLAGWQILRREAQKKVKPRQHQQQMWNLPSLAQRKRAAFFSFVRTVLRLSITPFDTQVRSKQSSPKGYIWGGILLTAVAWLGRHPALFTGGALLHNIRQQKYHQSQTDLIVVQWLTDAIYYPWMNLQADLHILWHGTANQEPESWRSRFRPHPVDS